MTFKAGDKVKCIDNLLAEGYFKLNEQYVIDEIPYDDHVCFTHAGDVAWDADRFELIEKEDTVKEPKQFNPEPGDKIICNNGEEFTCCTREFLLNKDLQSCVRFEILAYRTNPTNETIGIDWIGWPLDGKSTGSKEWDIREVIPKQKDKSGTNSFDKNDATQESYMEFRRNQDGTLSSLNVYTAEDIRSAFIDDLSWTESYLEMFMKSLEKVTKPEYKEYLRLKDMFEN